MRKIRRWLLTGALACVALARATPAPAPATEATLRYTADSTQGAFASGSMCPLQVAPPAGDWKLPKFQSDRPLYGELNLGDGSQLFVLDKAKADDPFYNRLYVDQNGNRDLTDDKPLAAGEQPNGLPQNYGYATFPSVDLTYRLGKDAYPYRFMLRLQASQLQRLSQVPWTDQNLQGMIYAIRTTQCGYEADLDLDGRRLHVVLVDNNCDGRLGAKIAKPTAANRSSMASLLSSQTPDNLFIGEEGQKFAYYDQQTLAETLVVGDKTYRVKADLPGKKLTLTPITENLGVLKLPGEFERLTLSSNGQAVSLYKPASQISLPLGSYRMAGYTLTRKDDQGDLWQLVASGSGSTTLPSVTIGAQPAELKAGEPIVMQVEASLSGGGSGLLGALLGGGSSNAALRLVLQGQGGETISDVSRVSGNKTQIPLNPPSGPRPKAPSYKVVTAQGELVTQGNFEYG
jgi:hypothetical protein